MTDGKGKGSAAAGHANAAATKDGHKNPRASSKAQAVLGRVGAKAKKKG